MGKNLSELTEADFTEITKLAAMFFTPREVAIMLELNIQQCVIDCEIQDNPVYNAFHSGRLQSELDLRTAVLKLAKSGSSTAQQMAFEMLKFSKAKMMDR